MPARRLVPVIKRLPRADVVSRRCIASEAARPARRSWADSCGPQGLRIVTWADSALVIKWPRCNLGRLHRVDLKLPPGLDAALAREAKLARKPKTTLAQRAIESYLEEAADYRAVLASRRRRGRTSTLAEVKKRLGLDRWTHERCRASTRQA